MSCLDIASTIGQRQLFLGVGTASWNTDQFIQAADFAYAHHIDSVLLKAVEGAIPWYGGINGFKSIAALFHAHGVGCIPYTYSYCNKFNALDAEIDILIEYMQACGVVVMDAEVEWNGQVSAAQHLTSRMQPVPGIFLVSTWADPDLQDWGGVIQALNPCVNAYMPQQYSNYLASCWPQFGAHGAKCIMPTVNITNGFGANDPVQIAKNAHAQGHAGLSIWYYDTAAANPGLLDQIVQAFPKTTTTTGGTTVNTTTYEPGKGDFVQWFTVGSDGNWTCKQTGAVLQGANKALYSQLSIDGNTLPVIGLPLKSEQYQIDSDGYHWSKQPCERGEIWYDPGHKHDGQPGFGASYLGKTNYNPPTVTVTTVSPAVKADLQQLEADATKAQKDAGI